MLNLVLSVIVFYYLVKTGDLFKLIKMAKKVALDLLLALKQEKSNLKNDNSPLEVLKLRYARGEISKDDYDRIAGSL